jgi:hypothetical protein
MSVSFLLDASRSLTSTSPCARTPYPDDSFRTRGTNPALKVEIRETVGVGESGFQNAAVDGCA